MREYPEERLIIERLWNRFNKDHLTAAEIAEFDGCCVRTAKERYNIQKGGMNITTLAHMKCERARK